MSKDSSYPVRSLKWHTARFFGNPDPKQHSKNGSIFLSTCLFTAAITGLLITDETPSDKSTLVDNEQVIERYEQSLAHISENYQKFYAQNTIETQNMLPGTNAIVTKDDNATFENKIKKDAINFLTATLTDATLSESDVENLLDNFSNSITPIEEFGFADLAETSFLDEAQQNYKDQHNTQNINNPEAAQKISRIADKMSDENEIEKMIGTVFGGLVGGFGIFILLASMIFAGDNKKRYQQIASQPKPTRKMGYKH